MELTPTMKRTGTFKGYEVTGLRLSADDGTFIWCVSSHKKGVGNPQFRVSGTEFRKILASRILPFEFDFEETTTEPDPAVREAILDAIRRWEDDHSD